MASTSIISMSVPVTCASSKKIEAPISQAFLKAPLTLKPSKSNTRFQFQVKASLKEKVVTGLTAAALTASMIVPDVAEAATVSPSLKNFLLSIVSGGVVVAAILGAVIAVSNFDPVKRT
ncbi:ultraviolet-B-repressible protein [Trifolium pratense]|uniref:Ultraviolet-B-repressible protein n=2 Tax=Trifolium pratense TaxID=57577 RepID=Q7XA95_TRIPR|nr:uncharacterized protein LOC123906286 [Trifolium pratense]AAQ21122.1 ultraviolet-B-repressible protein [Trifolium pratense]PNX61294.1 ultraviolet-B-repressible protein [Trifolium pratense]CAJ2649937.1 unnamed protein product [Trifolium pratense]